MSELDSQFINLGRHLEALISLLDEADEHFWAPYFRRGLAQVRQNRLAGATFTLGCYGGVDTFSDLVIGVDLRHTDPLKYRNLNARLGELRNRIFDAANAITSRQAW
jgi:hypothetical protein